MKIMLLSLLLMSANNLIAASSTISNRHISANNLYDLSQSKLINSKSIINFPGNQCIKFHDGILAMFPVSKDWKKHKADIEHLVKILKDNPDYFGYISFWSSSQVSKRKAQTYADEIKKYIVTKYKIYGTRVKFGYGGEGDKALFEIQVGPEAGNFPN